MIFFIGVGAINSYPGRPELAADPLLYPFPSFSLGTTSSQPLEAPGILSNYLQQDLHFPVGSLNQGNLDQFLEGEKFLSSNYVKNDGK
jgi:hypothetical protein